MEVNLLLRMLTSLSLQPLLALSRCPIHKPENLDKIAR
jgi:hypothetical protein